MIMNFFRYFKALPVVLKKISILHRYSVFLDEASPEDLKKSLRAWRLFKREYGYLRSLKENQCVDAQGDAIPWYTYPAYEQLSRWNFEDCDVLEYGCGNSTKWWAKNAKSVISIENSPTWYDSVSKQKPDNSELILSEVDLENVNPDQVQNYIDIVDKLGKFDVIIIDGVDKLEARKKCTKKAITHLKPGGLLIIDNSDWLPYTCLMLREQGFHEVDFSGLSPLNSHAETTSLFFKSDFKITPNAKLHPGYATGGLKLDLDEE